MKRFFIVAALGACCIALDAAGPRAPAVAAQISKASATVDVVPGKPYVIVHLTNLSKVALEARQINVQYDSGSALMLPIVWRSAGDQGRFAWRLL